MNTLKSFFLINTIQKSTIAFLLGLCFINTAFSQACTICSQAEVDNYVGDLSGNVVISGPDITNLDALSDNIPCFLCLFSFTLIDNPVLIDISGISQFGNYPSANFIIENNPLLETIDFPFLTQLESYFRIKGNASLDTINIPKLVVEELTIENNTSLVYIGLSEDVLTSNFTIDNNASLENLDWIVDLEDSTVSLVISNNAKLLFYCGLRDRILNDPMADITISGNLKNPSFGEILLEGSCGNFVRGLIGYPTLSEALIGANEHDFIYVERSNIIDVSTTFPGTQQNTLVIRPHTTLTFTAPFTNEGIVINHGTLEMISGTTFTNSGAFVNTGLLIAN